MGSICKLMEVITSALISEPSELSERINLIIPQDLEGTVDIETVVLTDCSIITTGDFVDKIRAIAVELFTSSYEDNAFREYESNPFRILAYEGFSISNT